MTEMPDSENIQQAMPAPTRRGPKRGLIILLVLIVGAGAFVGWWFGLRSASPEQVVGSFFDSAKAGDYEGVISCLTPKSAASLVKKFGGEQELRRKIKQSKEDFLQARVYPATYRDSGKTAIVKMETKTKDGSTVRTDAIDIVLVRERGRWKIDMDATIDLALAQSMDAGYNSGGSGGG